MTGEDTAEPVADMAVLERKDIAALVDIVVLVALDSQQQGLKDSPESQVVRSLGAEGRARMMAGKKVRGQAEDGDLVVLDPKEGRHEFARRSAV